MHKAKPGICLLAAVLACRGENKTSETAPPDTVSREAAAPRGPVVLADPQITNIVMTANAIEVALGQLAQQRASDEEVRNFAATMVSDHSAIYREQAALAQQLGINPGPHPIAEQHESTARQTEQALQQLHGAQFDRVYMANEIVMHQNLLDSLQSVFVPRTENPQMREFLEKVRATVAAHLRMARTIERRLNPRGPGSDD